MNLRFQWKLAGALVVGLSIALAATGAPAPKTANAAGDSSNVTMTVTAAGKKDKEPPAIKKEDVELYRGKERLQVADWKRGDSLFLAVLIDDSLDTEAASNWNDLKGFFNAQPQSTYIAVGYARNSTVMVAQDFTTDRVLAAKALRIPLGGPGAFSSPYLALQDWLKRWPSGGGDRRSVLMISSGVDYFRGGFDPIDPDLDSTIERAQKQNTNVWTIYFPDGSHVGRAYFRGFNAQSNLSRLSEETGAESYYLGLGSPVSLKPYFDEIQGHLNNQYLLTWSDAAGGKKGKFERVRVATEVPGAEFIVPSQVFLPPSQ